MQDLSIKGVSKVYGDVTAVQQADLDLAGGKMVSFLGPSGCGKTTLLRMISGLDLPTTGSITLGDRDITSVPTHQRNMGMVFQSLALFPHLSVGENIAYGLRIRGVGKAEQVKRAKELLELVQLPGTEDRHITQLSGGQRQRIAIARALALEPDVFLLDEPMSALDANLRESMQIELRQLQQRLGITTIVVTHDQGEAMTMSDTIVVMSAGRIEQVGPPLEIYRNPVNKFVADFIGLSNMVEGKMTKEGAVRVNNTLISACRGTENRSDGEEVTVLIRPEELHVVAGEQAGNNRLVGSVEFIRDIGATVEIIVNCDGHSVSGIMTPKDRPDVQVGSTATVEFPPQSTSVL
jgi:putative spermidine/putrescine transport system ATP-binding protein